MTKINTYPKNATVKVHGLFYNDSGELVDPTGVIVQIITPAGVQTDYTYGAEPDENVERTAVGTYYFEVEGTAAGVWKYRWFSTGGRSGGENEFEIAGSSFTDPS